ncbi:MAG: YhdT family protein [Neofamilia sp.]
MDKQFSNNTYSVEELESAKNEITSPEGYILDPRYKECNREAKLGLGLGILNLVMWFAFGYGIGSGPVDAYTYVMGLPLWFFLSCIVTPIVIIILMFIITGKMDDMPLEKFTEEQAVEYEAKMRRKQ